MKSLIVRNPYQAEMTEIPDPTPGEGEALIRMRILGLCGSDLKTYTGGNPLVSYPRIPGHEVAGEIVDTGPGVPKEFQPGLRVTVSPYTSCGICKACRAGRVDSVEFLHQHAIMTVAIAPARTQKALPAQLKEALWKSRASLEDVADTIASTHGAMGQSPTLNGFANSLR